jgi:transposase InsO family protein
VSVSPCISAEKAAERTVAKACALMEVSRSAFYVWHRHEPGPRARADTELTGTIVEIHRASRGTYGSPRITAVLARDGEHVGRKRVARRMAIRGLAGRRRRRPIRTTIPDPGGTPTMVDRLKRCFAPGSVGLDRISIGDITDVRTHEGWLYLATCLDLASRRVVGFSMADHMRASLACDALTMAIKRRHPAAGFLFHPDRGSQYTSRGFRALLDQHQGCQSLSRPRQCWDNAVAESCFGTLKEELVHRQTFPTRAAARASIFEFIEVFYNQRRRHSSLGYLTPAEYEEQRRSQSEAA